MMKTVKIDEEAVLMSSSDYVVGGPGSGFNEIDNTIDVTGWNRGVAGGLSSNGYGAGGVAPYIGDFPQGWGRLTGGDDNALTTLPGVIDTTISNGGITFDSVGAVSVSYRGLHRKNTYRSPDGNYHIDVDVTGYAKDQIEVQSVGQKIVVRLFKSHQDDFVDDVDENVYDVQEVFCEDWTHEFLIGGDYDVDSLKAKKWENGLLKIEVPVRDAKTHEF